MTTAKKGNAKRFAKGAHVRPLTRRRFVSTLISRFASAYAVPSLLDFLGAERGLLAEAAELAREAVTVDLHCHPNKLGGPHFPDPDPDVPGNMKAGGLDAVLRPWRLPDYPPSSSRREFALVSAGLLSRGYSASDVEKIVGGNFIRVFREVTEGRR